MHAKKSKPINGPTPQDLENKRVIEALRENINQRIKNKKDEAKKAAQIIKEMLEKPPKTK